MDEYKHKIIAVDWWKGRPHEVLTRKDNWHIRYDIDWDQEGQGYYHCSGGGGRGSPTNEIGGTEGLPASVETFGDFIKHYDLIHAKTIYCKICDDWMPDDEECEHLIWDDEVGCWSGPGSTE